MKCKNDKHWENIIIMGQCPRCGLGTGRDIKDNEPVEIKYMPYGRDDDDVVPEIN